VTEGAGRDPLRPIIGAATCFLLYRVLLYFLVPVGEVLGGRMIALTVPPLLAAGVSSALAMAIFESRRLSDIGLAWMDGALRNLLTGICLGVAAAALSVLPAVALGFAHFEHARNADVSFGAAVFTPVLLFCGALGEEIAFRGFALQYLMRGYGRWIAILSTAALFGALHAGNPDATAMSTINTAAFGIVLAAAVLRSRDLWLAAGIHFAWNTVLPFLGVGLSGLTIKVTGYEVIWSAGNFWSGGKYGPEASGVTSAITVLLFAAIWKVPVTPGSAYMVAESRPSALPS
jgi:membrane protease YdiL (CAAX protease family)